MFLEKVRGPVCVCLPVYVCLRGGELDWRSIPTVGHWGSL